MLYQHNIKTELLFSPFPAAILYADELKDTPLDYYIVSYLLSLDVIYICEYKCIYAL